MVKTIYTNIQSCALPYDVFSSILGNNYSFYADVEAIADGYKQFIMADLLSKLKFVS